MTEARFMKNKMPTTRRQFILRVSSVAVLQTIGIGASLAELPLSQTKRHYVDGRFGQIHVHIARPLDQGTESLKTPLMCFHPTHFSGDYYRDFIAEMGRDRIAMAMDTPGYGKSDRPPEPQLMDQLAGAAADALDALGYGANGAGPVDVLGYHTGDFIATELAILRPDLVRRLVLVGIPFDEGEERQKSYEENFKPMVIQEDGSHLNEEWAFAVTNRQPGVTLERAAEHYADGLLSLPYSSWAYHAVFLYDVEAQFPKVMQPSVILNTHGGLKENSRAVMPYLKDVRIVEIPELHHGVFDLGVEKLARESRAFLDTDL